MSCCPGDEEEVLVLLDDDRTAELAMLLKALAHPARIQLLRHLSS